LDDCHREQNLELLSKLTDSDARLRYAEAILIHKMERPGFRGLNHQPAPRPPRQAITNFSKALAPAGSDIAHQILNDPCQFDGLSVDNA